MDEIREGMYQVSKFRLTVYDAFPQDGSTADSTIDCGPELVIARSKADAIEALHEHVRREFRGKFKIEVDPADISYRGSHAVRQEIRDPVSADAENCYH